MTGRPVRKGRSPSRKADEVKPTAGRPKSAGRSKSPGRPKSPGRTKSPSRAAAKSPSRKSPGRPAAKRSPSPVTRKPSSRAAALAAAAAAKKPITPPRVDDVFIDLKADKIKLAPYLAAVAERERSNSQMAGSARSRTLSAEVSASALTRRSARVASIMQEKLEVENDVSTTTNNTASSSTVEREPTNLAPREFGGWLGALFFMLLLPVILIASQLYCNQTKCPDDSFPTAISRKWRDYLDAEAAACVMGFVALQLLLSLLPIGKLVDGPPARTGRFQYRCNGVYTLVLTLATIGGLYYYLGKPMLRVLDKQLALAVAALLFSLLSAILLYVRGRRAPVAALNPHGDTGNFLVDLWMGREINPRLFGRVDLKWIFYRIAVVGLIVVDLLLVVKSLESQTMPVTADGKTKAQPVPWSEKEYPLALCLAAAMQALYALDAVMFERAYPGTFDGSSEGLGFMITVGLLTYPFLPSIIVKYLTLHKSDLPMYGLALVFLVHTVGYIIFRASNSQKMRFRQNPLDPALAHLETIQTSRGKKLLVSGWWGWVRHPNYLGDILMQWSWAACVGTTHWLPYIVPLVWTTFFLHRAARDSARCRQRYGIYWERYTQRVKSLVIPKIY